jgi:agarase
MTWDSSINASAYRASTLARFGNDSAWARDAAHRLRGWGFNSAGAWSSLHMENVSNDAADDTDGGDDPDKTAGGAMLFAVMLDMGVTWTETVERLFPDVFDPAWARRVRAVAERECAPRRAAKNLLGYFPDNELNWAGHWPAGHGCSRQHPASCISTSLLTWFLLRPPATAGARAALAFAQQRYNGSLAALNAAWGTAAPTWAALGAGAPFPMPPSAARAADDALFLGAAAERYHNITTSAIRAADPHHLVIGYRQNGALGDDPALDPAAELLYPVLSAAGRWVDVLDYHSYSAAAPLRELALMHEHGGGRPVMVSEFGFRAQDSGLPNTVGPGPLVATQQQRAAGFEGFVRALVTLPYVIGYHAFAWVDEPAGGNGWGENSNYGVVHLDGDPYEAVTDMWARVQQGELQALHARGGG